MKLPIRWKPFIISFCAVFIVSALSHAGVKLPAFQGAVSLPKVEKSVQEVLNSLRPLLEKKQNSFKLKKETGFVPQAYAGGLYEQAGAYLLMDMSDGSILSEKNISEKLPIASLTKIMTALVSLDLASEDELFDTTEKAAGIEPTKLGVQMGEQFMVSELLHAVLLTSANDAAQILADGIDKKYGKKGTFVAAMNEKARILGLNNTCFDNPQGYDGDCQYSTTEDLAVLTHYALTKYPVLADMVTKDWNNLQATEHHGAYYIPNWNGLLNVYPEVFGIKTGNTDLAGHTMVVGSARDGKKLLAILLAAPGILERDLWVSELLDMGYQSKWDMEPVGITEWQLREKYLSWSW